MKKAYADKLKLDKDNLDAGIWMMLGKPFLCQDDMKILKELFIRRLHLGIKEQE